MTVRAYPHTVGVTRARDAGYRWSCGCGQGGWFALERLARDTGAVHQAAHQAAFDAWRRSLDERVKEKARDARLLGRLLEALGAPEMKYLQSSGTALFDARLLLEWLMERFPEEAVLATLRGTHE